MNRLLKICLLVWLLAVCVGCTKAPTETPSAGTDYTRVNGKTFYFLAEEELEALREPLERLLSNENCTIYADTPRGEIIGYRPHDPDMPSIPEGYRCGLYDATGDGIPELLVHPNGYYGSSGTATYFVYDIVTGEEIGSMDGGNSESWCVYYVTESDELVSVGSYWRRGGWSDRYRVMTLLRYDSEEKDCYEELYLYAHLGIGHAVPDEGAPVEEWGEEYPYASYSVRGKDVYLDEYYAELDWFTSHCVRLPETELCLIDWDEVCEDEDDRFIRAQKMAEALLSSHQKFVVPTP